MISAPELEKVSVVPIRSGKSATWTTHCSSSLLDGKDINQRRRGSDPHGEAILSVKDY